MTPLQKTALETLQRIGPMPYLRLKRHVPRLQWKSIIALIDEEKVEGDNKELRAKV
jgi:hypothetical protein